MTDLREVLDRSARLRYRGSELGEEMTAIQAQLTESRAASPTLRKVDAALVEIGMSAEQVRRLLRGWDTIPMSATLSPDRLHLTVVCEFVCGGDRVRVEFRDGRVTATHAGHLG